MTIINQTKYLTTYSASLVISNYFEDTRIDKELENASGITKFMVYTGCEVGFLFATLIGIVETVFWAALAVVFKIPHILFPESKSKWANLVYAQVVTNLNGGVLGLSEAAVMTISNYFETSIEIKDTLIKVMKAVDSAFEKCDGFFSYHLFK
jgi:hypothetical protein